MNDTLYRRGPDDSGVWLDGDAGLGACRLAVIDPSVAGHMPMSTPDGRYHLVYNGELYNFRELRRELEATGVRFQSGSDTEVFLQLYAAHGPDMLHRCHGMFAAVIWDAAERALFAVRDRCGVKPLFHAVHRGM